MTKVRCVNDRETYTIDIEGHSEFNPGMDIVCSACSILGFTLMNAIENQDADIKEIDYENGEIYVVVKGNRSTKEAIRIIIETIMLGFEQLAEQYPLNVELEW